MTKFVKKNAKTCLALLLFVLLAFPMCAGRQGVLNVLAGTLENGGYLDPSESGGNEDVIDFGGVSKEDGYIGTAMPETMDASSTETDYYIESVEQFNYFQTHSKSNCFEGITIHLAANVELDEGFVGIGSFEQPFAGTFDGHGYSITKLSSTENGLFVAVEGATIQKLLIGSANVTLTEASSNVGLLAGTVNGATVDRVVISGSKIISEAVETSAIGGMFGKVTGDVAISNASIKRLTIKTAGRTNAVGGYVGQANAVLTMDVCKIANSYIRSNYISETESVSYLGGVIGYATETVIATDVYAVAMNVKVASPVNGMGIMAGYLSGTANSFEACAVDVATLTATANENSNVGMFVGYADAESTYVDCSMSNERVNGTEETFPSDDIL